MSSTGPFFVVGCARSGTTLVRLMLNSHPRLAVPPESEWIVGLATDAVHPGKPDATTTATVLERILAHPKFGAWTLDPRGVRRAVATSPPGRLADLLVAPHAVWAKREGKLRWGDKTPDYVRHLELLSDLFDDARFIHVLRDGREVAASLVDQVWWPQPIARAAEWWCESVIAGRAGGERLGPARYLELRLEDLVADPSASLSVVCSFLGERYFPEMLRFQPARRSFRSWNRSDQISHRHLLLPPTPGLRDWRRGVSATDQAAVERICAPQLRELGYATG